MWGALKADFSEFVSVVTTDATDVLQAIDSQMDEEDDNNKEGVPLIDPDTGILLEQAQEDNDTSITKEEEEDETPVSKEEMKQFLYTCDDVYLDPIVEVAAAADDDGNTKEDVLKDINEKTEEISKLLEDNPDTLQTTFTRLTDQVEYKEFWKRYFYRLEEDRLEETYQKYYSIAKKKKKMQQEEEEKRKASQKHESALSSVTKFLGGAVKRLVEDDDGDEENDDDDGKGSPNAFFHTAQQTSGAMNFFKTGRPPFVLNTAVSEDEDQGDEGEDEEDEEEELGWDDDDEDDDLEGLDDNDNNNRSAEDDEDHDQSIDKTEQIEFKDAEKERLQEELDQAIAERDLLHKTVEMQAEELKKLKEFSSGDENKQVEALRMHLFEKDSEIAALRARLEDDEHDGHENKADKKVVELEELKVALASKESELVEVQKELATLKQRLTASPSEPQNEIALQQAQAENAGLKQNMEALQQAMLRLEAENESMRQQTQTSGNEAEVNLARMQQEFTRSQSQVESLTAQMHNVCLDLEASQSRVADLEGALQTIKMKLESKETELQNKSAKLEKTELDLQTLRSSLDAKKTELQGKQAALEQAEMELKRVKDEFSKSSAGRPSSPGSSSTGVKLSLAPSEAEVEPKEEVRVKPAVVKKLGADDEEDDAWDDDW